MDEIFKEIRARDFERSNEQAVDQGNVLKSLYLKRDSLIVRDLFPVLRSKLLDPRFQVEFLRHYKSALNSEREYLTEMALRSEASRFDSRFYTLQFPRLDRQLSISTFDEYQEFLRDPGEGHLGLKEILTQNVESYDANSALYVDETYVLYEVARVLYDQYSSRVSMFERFDQLASAELVDVYRRIDVDLKGSDEQFLKYHLLTLQASMRIANDKNYISLIDERIGKHFLVDVPRRAMNVLEHLLAKKLVGSMAFNITSIMDFTPAFESLEYGSLFNFDALRLPEVSRLYDGGMYDDSLWVRMDKPKQSLTFEELCSDFPEHENMVVTQLVHLQFFQENDQYFIHHLDHEYIRYTLDEYAMRTGDPSTKGHKKLKTFKIDKARIPFDFTFDGQHIVFLILDAYFKNKALIQEYFSKVAT
ncbi:hypothetical protein [Pseudoxanthomonas mexicana]